MNLPSLKPLERSAFGFFYGGKITLSHHLIKQKCCIWGSGSLWTERTDDQIFKELHQNFLVLFQFSLRKHPFLLRSSPLGKRPQRRRAKEKRMLSQASFSYIRVSWNNLWRAVATNSHMRFFTFILYIHIQCNRLFSSVSFQQMILWTHWAP